MVKKLKTPLIYYGGKTKMATEIIKVIPPHTIWIDVFGGGAAVTIQKRPSDFEVYNDVGFVHKFFEMLRDPIKSAQLIYALKHTPWSRTEFEECSLSWQDSFDDVETVRRWVVLINQGFTHRQDSKSWLLSTEHSTAAAWANHVDTLPLIAERFRKIVIECRSFEWIIPKYDSVGACFYCDPPYMPNSHSDEGKGYIDEMTIPMHEHLLSMLNTIKGQAIVSGYSSPLYDEMLKDWRVKRVTRPGHIHSAGQTVKSRTECIWIKDRSHGSIWAHSDDTTVSLQGRQ